jgi:hypothetical protein
MSAQHPFEPRAIPSLSKYVIKQIVFPLLVTGAAGLGLAGCGADSITGISQQSFTDGISANLTGGLGGDDGLFDDEAYWKEEVPVAESRKAEKTDDELKDDPDFNSTTETTFPTTEAHYNTCTDELVVLNGHQKQRIQIQTEGQTLRFNMRVWKDLRGIAASTDIWVDDDGNEFTPRVKKTVRYHNKTRTVDEFKVGPVDGLPYESRFESVYWLQREGGWRKHGWDTRKLPGDDLFVYVIERIRVNQDGTVRQKSEFRAECR